mmetsp:Transcript_20249/g.29029  ORF Transcript_20249/g.29029 Transcript_20249/m.29029 type:complete len:528 (+) Transcript_20249:2-1585(+)
MSIRRSECFLNVCCTLFTFVWTVNGSNYYFRKEMQREFQNNFHDRCDKYAFVHKWVHLLDNPPEKHLIFVYEESGLRNGGLGDRLGGLISAVAMALRFDRQLLLRASNGLENIFRPYHPHDIKTAIPRFTWDNNNWTSWSKYDGKYCCDDKTEYDLWMCINNGGAKITQCGMHDGDVPQPHILLRSNRAYLCSYHNRQGSNANEGMRKQLGIAAGDDLYEAAGCMLRLALWPTDALWDEVDRLYQQFDESVRHPRHLQSPEPAGWQSVHQAGAFFQVGLHFRCGDRSFLLQGGYDAACVWDEARRGDAAYMSNFLFGSPVQIAQCANTVLRNHSLSLMAAQYHHGSHGPGRRGLRAQRGLYEDWGSAPEDKAKALPPPEAALEAAAGGAGSPGAGAVGPAGGASHSAGELLNTMLFVTSDNVKAAQQMSSVVGHPYSLLTPQGCHIELDPSPQCHMFTVSYWFMLSLSEVIVTQVLPDSLLPEPSSAFSKYAGMYGLKRDPFRNSLHCDDIVPTLKSGYVSSGNWWC